ncbi:MAG: hypothetical protein AAFY57_04780 [Cyanobacteria bacterium J06642_2]
MSNFLLPLLVRLIALAIVLVLQASPALAAQWELAASVGEELHQYVDLESVRASPSLRRVASYFTDARSPDIQRTDYTTLYDCKRGVFKDLSENGKQVYAKWHAPTDDPLNLATMNYVCALDLN